MQELILKILDIFFFGFHTVIILFNIFGWIVPRWCLTNFIVLLLTAFSWFILGIWYGWGYCIFTDWHWQVRKMLGYHDLSSSYIHFLILKISGVDLDASFVDTVTVVAFLFGPDLLPAPNGVIAEGDISAGNVIGPLAGDLNALIEAMRSGNIYVNVHTVAHPGGEIRGQL